MGLHPGSLTIPLLYKCYTRSVNLGWDIFGPVLTSPINFVHSP